MRGFYEPLWQVRGSYFEVCNCEAPCPCRRHGGRPGSRSQFDTCDFALSWQIVEGHFGSTDLGDLRVAIAGRWDNNEPAKLDGPAHPWHVILYIDEHADAKQNAAIADIFLGRSGGTALQNYAKSIGEVYAIKSARIEMDHYPGKERLRIGELVQAETARPFFVAEPVTCGIPGHNQPGQELVASVMTVHDGPLQWTVNDRCAFATRFEYSSTS